MVGLSLADPNLRRLLEIGARDREEPTHFAFLSRADPPAEGRPVSPDSAQGRLLERHHQLMEGVLEELGVSVVWVRDYRVKRRLDSRNRATLQMIPAAAES
jgi:hypothetical protein